MDIEAQRLRAEMAISNARRVGQQIRAEQDRIVSRIEVLLHEAKEIETIDALRSLARHILDPINGH